MGSGTPPASKVAPTILVVDDDEGLLVLLEGAMRGEAWNVVTETSGAGALAWLGNHRADLLLLDLKLKDVGAREFIGLLDKAGRSLPFIVITGQGDERVAVDMMKRGALDYLVKDVHFIELVPAVVQKVLEQVETTRRLTEAEEALGRSEALKRAVMHSLTSHIAVLDHTGNVIAVNEAWNRFARANGEVNLARTGVGTNYLEVCRRSMKGGASQAGQAFQGIQDVLAGSLDRFSMEYDCHTPEEEHWFTMAVTPLGKESDGAVISHSEITERKKLEQALLDVTEREQRRFGQDLHDGLGQRLTGLEMLSHALAEELKNRAADLAKQARRLNRELRETITQARLMSHSIAPVPLEGDGLMRALRELAASTSRISGIKCRFLCPAPVELENAVTANHLYRIAQEAVTNALKHGRAKQIDIGLQARVDGLELSVQNNGRAIPASARPHQGMGLNLMRYRASTIGAGLSIESRKRSGVRVVCTLRKRP